MNIKSLITGIIFIILMDLILIHIIEKKEKLAEESQRCTLAKLEIQTNEKVENALPVQMETKQKNDKPIYVCTDWYKFVTLNEPRLESAYTLK